MAHHLSDQALQGLVIPQALAENFNENGACCGMAGKTLEGGDPSDSIELFSLGDEEEDFDFSMM